ncbi:AAA domain-containing protein [Azoarcus indigens]|uniref:Regulatory Fis family protein n=1 Tax=Azoarcus indigens TaxID=29545 RepID=A0A4V3BMI6_9RHOO|nr:sigma-54-dependent Fis family transcriptional regulator [Azoarcus indigens]NMG64802.1 AAA domain-containing protein [Azoarcus indigens]TDN50812.1 regulatory Fis family protein [Azoarcus indigens]
MGTEKQGLVEQFNLRSRLRFDIDGGNIWLDESRMLLLHAQAMGALRTELFRSLGVERARGLLVRMGFASGQQDADLARKLFRDSEREDVFRLGPELHAFEGLVRTRILNAQLDWEQGSFIGDVKWENSWEAEAHVRDFGIGDSPACWSLIGYASGYVTRFFNRFIVFRETHCVGKGDEHCVLVGKPAEEWGNADAYLDYFRPGDIEGELAELREELARLRASLGGACQRDDLIGSSPAFEAAFELVRKAAGSAINVLLLGETGVGKEVFARWLHAHSDRADKPFVAINCAAIPHDLIEAELFGVQKGAYTGAQQSRAGRFERADGGTLFLDEVGDLSPAAQVKLLRVLQSGEVERLGDDQTRKVNVRLVAATNVNLPQAIRQGSFRADLYYRLATYPVAIPPLRDRRSDIPLLAQALLGKYEAVYHKKLQGITDRAIRALVDYPWPGNVRELENVIERGVLLAPPGGRLEEEHLFAGAESVVPAGVELDTGGHLCDARESSHNKLCEALLKEGFNLEAHEARLIELAVQQAKGNLTHAARALGITRRQLAYRLKQNTAAAE